MTVLTAYATNDADFVNVSNWSPAQAWGGGSLNQPTSIQMETGYADGGKSGAFYYKSAVLFDVSSIPAAAVVSAATMTLVVSSATASGTIVANRVTAPWSESSGTLSDTLTGQTGPVGTKASYTSGYAASVSDAALVAIVAGWVAGSFSNYGLSLGEGAFTGTQTYFRTRETTAGTTDDPVLTVTYNRAPGAPGAFTNPTGGTVRGTITVGWGAATDPESDTLTYELAWSQNGGAKTTIATGISGTSQSWNSSTVPDGANYRLHVRAKDAAGSNTFGPYTDSASFTLLQNVAPTIANPGTNPSGVVVAGTKTIGWTFADANGDAQAKYYLRRQLGGALSFSDAFTGTDGAAWDTSLWEADLQFKPAALTSGATSILTNTGSISVVTNGTGGGYGGLYKKSKAGTFTDAVVTGKYLPGALAESYTGIVLREGGGLGGSGANADHNDGYYVELDPSGNIYFYKVVAGVGTGFAATRSYTFSTSTATRFRFEVSGTTVRYRVWQDGASEPGTWDASVTDSALSAGSFGINFEGGNASRSRQVTVDDIVLTGPTASLEYWNGTTWQGAEVGISSAVASVAVPFTATNTYVVSVAAEDALAAKSAYTTVATFTTATAPTVTITAPANASTVSTGGPSLTVAWTYAQAETYAQATYRVRVQNAAGSTTYYDSGVLVGTTASMVLDLIALGVPTDTTGSALKVVVDVTSATITGATATNSKVFDVQWGVVTATITAPASGGIIATPTLTATWTFASTRSKTQASYRVRLLFASSGAVAYDSGFTAGSAASLLLPVSLVDGATYEVEVTLKNSEGVVSA